jgi:hypothetical protein
VVITIIASSVLLLSVAVVSAADHAFDQISLALPIFFILFLLATSIGEWLELEECFIESTPRLSSIRPRAPPA